MTGWNFDISQAPRGKTVETVVQTAKGPRGQSRFVPDRVILATKCGKVTLSHYIPDEDRWMMLGKGEQPDAWFAWPTHPSQIAAVNGGHAPTDDAVPSGDESTALIRNRRAAIWASITSLAAREAGNSAAPNSNSPPTSSTAADSPAFDAPLALGTYSFAGVI